MATMSPPTTQDPRWGNVVISATPDELRAVKPFLRSLRLLAIELAIRTWSIRKRGRGIHCLSARQRYPARSGQPQTASIATNHSAH